MEDLVAEVARVLDRSDISYRRWVALGLYRSVALVVALMRENLTQQAAGGFFGVSQPTVSRRWDQVRDAIGEATDQYRPNLAAWRGSVLVDGTLVRPGIGRPIRTCTRRSVMTTASTCRSQ